MNLSFVKTAVCWMFVCSTIAIAADVQVGKIPGSQFEVISGQVQLPSGGLWRPKQISNKHVKEFYLIPSDDVTWQQVGKRMRAVLEQRRINQGRWKTRMPYWAFVDYARGNHGQGPGSLADLDSEKYRYLIDNLQTSPWHDLDFDGATKNKSVDGPFVYIVPNAKFNFDQSNPRQVPRDDREILAVELRPFVNDGKHWILYTDGNCIREEIGEFVKLRKITIRPVITDGQETKKSLPTLSYSAVAVTDGTSAPNVQVELYNAIDGNEHHLDWKVTAAKPDPNVMAALKRGREYRWSPYLKTGTAPTLRMWLNRPQDNTNLVNGRPNRELNMLAVMGGRSAIEETLQLQNLAAADKQQAATIELASIRGVEVKGHPYEKMLGEDPGGELDLANFVAPDRFFVYVAKPKTILPFLDHGAQFLAATGAGITGNRIDYGLTNRYLNRLGISRQILENLLDSGFVKDMAVSVPDLFLIDGTDMTVTIRLNQPKFLAGFLRFIGIRIDGNQVAKMKSPDGRNTFWAFRKQLLCLSTNRAELERTLELIDHDGEGSLGRSAEFRYMLTQVPVKDSTRLFVYFSDPFVRRLVGPEVKIGQLRRMKARILMEFLTSQRLLGKLNGIQDASIESLVKMDYLPDHFPLDGFEIDSDGLVRSDRYGPLTKLETLPDVPFRNVTPAEREAYDRYRDNYSRFWRQFFDPIAIRLDDDADHSLELTTFILPLIDSSIYNQLRTVLYGHEDERPLLVPQVKPDPILQFSVNLRDEAWQQVAGNFADFFRDYGGASPALLDDLGPSAHVAMFDADPIIALGSGDVMGAFGGNALRMGSRNEMLMVPIALSMLTRPCSIWIETKNPERTAQFLRQAAGTRAWLPNRDNNFAVSFHQVEDQDSWVWTMNIFNVVKLRYGVEVSGQHLVIRNIPWSTKDKIVKVDRASLASAQLTVRPGACKLQLPGLFATASEQERRATMSGLGRLYPFMLVGNADIESAIDEHQRLFGFHPVHPGDGNWQWDGMHLQSTTYGSPWKQRQPAFDPDRQFGLMQAIESLSVNMQFEDAGLRSIIKWKLRQN